MTDDAQPTVKRKPGRPRIVLTSRQEAALNWARFNYMEYRRAQKEARERVRAEVSAKRAMSARAIREALATGLSMHQVTQHVAKHSNQKTIQKIIEGAGNDG